MNGSQSHTMHRFLPETIAHGSVTEGIGALAVVILAILGLVGVLTNVLAAIATVVTGLIFLGDSMLARSAGRALNAEGTPRMGAGVSGAFLGGITGIVLGIVSFFHPMPARFIAVAVLLFGATLFLSGRTLSHLNSLLRPAERQEASLPASSGDIIMGLAVTVLGILAAIGLAPMTLALVGLLGLGIAALFGGVPGEATHDEAHL